MEVILTVPERYDLETMAHTLTKLATANAEWRTGWKFSQVSVDGPLVQN